MSGAYVTGHYAEHEYFVSLEDMDVRQLLKWRVIVYAHGGLAVVATAPWSPGDRLRKRNVYLTRVIGARMGLDPALQINHRNGNALDCRRENLTVETGEGAGQEGGSGGRRVRALGPTPHPRQNPEGTHRHKIDDHHPPHNYSLCLGPDAALCDYDIVAFARRTQPRSQQWRLRLRGSREWSEEAVAWHSLHTLLTVTSDGDHMASADQERAE